MNDRIKGFCKIINELPLRRIDDKDEAIIGVLTKAYMYILRSKDWGKELKIDNEAIIYNILKNGYNKLSISAMNNLPSMTHDIIKEVVHRTSKNSKRLAKKNSSRIYREAIRAFKTCHSGDEMMCIKKALNRFHLAYRETFILYRVTLSAEKYSAIPASLKIQLNGKEYSIIDLYVLNSTTNKYQINPMLKIKPPKMKDIQYAIAPYTFDVVHENNKYI